MNLIKSEFEEALAKYLGRKYCLLVGRATTAIFLAIKAFKFKEGNIIIPSVVCPNPIYSVLYNDLKPRFCDINLKDYTIDIDSFRNSINEDTKAVIPINLYGYPADYNKLLPLCKENNIKVIEDAAQSFGGTFKGKKMGAFGDISVISFGHTKIIDVNSGGAILTDDIDLFNQIKIGYEKLSNKPSNLIEMSELYRKAYYTLQPLWQKYDELFYLYSSFPDIFKSIYLFKFPEEITPKLKAEFEKIEQYVEMRYKNAKKYIKLLENHHNIILPKYEKNNGVYWRFSFLIKGDNQINISTKLRKKGFDVSNWYPSTHKMFIPPGKLEPFHFKNSDFLEKHVFNFWVDPEIKESVIEDTCNELIQILNKISED